VADDSRRLLALLKLPGEAVALAAPQPWRLVYSNSVLQQWLDDPAWGASEVPITSVLRTSPNERLVNEMERVSRGDAKDVRLEATLIRRASDDRELPVVIHLAPMEFGTQRGVGLIMQREENPSMHGHKDRRDSLTNLPDRSELFGRLETLMQGQRATDRRVAVLFIDLDEFKQVNDSHGHMAGDRVLREVARRLAECIRAEDLVVRFGGDEFVALIENAASWEEYQPVIARMRAALNEPITVPSGILRVSASIGAAELSSAHRIPEDLLADADRAMYAVKRRRSAAASALTSP
jgi:diguanylate cyclase (GGDEF)-like protein